MICGRNDTEPVEAKPCRRASATPLKPLVLARLALYHICLHHACDPDAGKVFSSKQIAACVGVDDTQVRKDIALLGVRGRPHVGFRRDEVIEAIHSNLGLDQTYKTVIVGAGRLGGAIAEYPGFKEYGLSIVAMLDTDPLKIGSSIGEHIVRPLSGLKGIVGDESAALAILTCPATAAQAAADLLVDAGIRAIWNFAPTQLNVPDGVVVRYEHIFTGLAELTYHLAAQRRVDGRERG